MRFLPRKGPWGRPRLRLKGILVPLALAAGAFVAAWELPFGTSPPGLLSGDMVTHALKSEAIVGRASVIDGDTIEIHGRRIRLYGIDAPESGQYCLIEGYPTRCGQRAALALADKIGQHPVSCRAKDTDVYGRTVAVCEVDGEDVNAWMTVQGWALAYRKYSSDYVVQEQEAAAHKRGIWQGEFINPWDWRNEHRDGRTAASPLDRGKQGVPSSNCNIKGNISASGERIYHVPGGAFYAKTIITTSKGERWFCSEAEAQAAGWRPSKR